MKFLRDIPNAEGKTALVRLDLDTPIQDGKIEDETRIKAALPSIEFLLKRGAKLILMGHLGRPNGRDDQFSLKPVGRLLSNLINREVVFSDSLNPKNLGNINLLENLRFWPGEEANDEKFGRQLAALGDLYVNDAFAACHRAHASIVLLPGLLPAYVGSNLEREIRQLQMVLENPKRPLVALIGGAKIETKLPAIHNLAKIADKVLVAGKLMFSPIGENLGDKVIIANDNIDGKDIGPKSIADFSKIISQAASVVWNGPMGVFEDEKYAEGTKAMALSIINSQAYSILGGGDTIAALNKFGLLDKISYVSTGGGAMLDFLAGKKLPGLEALG